MQRRLLVLALSLSPVALAAQGPREFGAARFEVPAGFTADATPTRLTYSRIRGQELCMIVVYGAEQAPPGLNDAFNNAWSTVFQPNMYRRRDAPVVSVATSPAGYRHATGEGNLEAQAGGRYYAHLYVFPVGGRTQTVVWMGNTQQALDGCKREWDAFFASLRFPSVSATADAPAPVDVPSVPGTPQKFDNMEFAPPSGWSVTRAGDAMMLRPPRGNPDEYLEVALLTGHRLTTGLPNEFAATWQELRGKLGMELMRSVNGGSYDLGETLRTYAGWEYLRGTGAMRPANGLQHDIDLYLIRAGDRVERVAVIARSLRDRSGVLYTSANKPAWNAALRTFLAGLRFANQPTTPATSARLGQGPIGGVWNGIGMSFSEFKTEFAIFFDNGMAYFGPKFSIDGLYAINPAAEQLRSPRYWGTYTFANGQGTLTMLYGSIPLRSSGSALVLTTNRTDHRYIRRSMPADPRLSGTYCLVPGALARSTDSPQSGPCIAFTAAGRFEENGAVKVLEHEVYVYDETPASGAGRYEIRDFTLVLRYDSGREVRIAFPGFLEAPSQSAPQLVLGFNEDVLKRR